MNAKEAGANSATIFDRRIVIALSDWQGRDFFQIETMIASVPAPKKSLRVAISAITAPSSVRIYRKPNMGCVP